MKALLKKFGGVRPSSGAATGNVENAMKFLHQRSFGSFCARGRRAPFRRFSRSTLDSLMKRNLLLLLIGLLLPRALPAQSVPALINFQGQVLAADGTPLATGDYTVTFQLFDAAEGGTLIWGPQVMDGTGGVGRGPRVPVVQGHFNVMLGPVDTASRPLTGAFLGAIRFLEIKVGTNNPISPRQQILSAPYALNAGNAATVLAGGVSTSSLADGAVTTVKIGDGVVSEIKLGNGSVTASKVADGSISASKLAQEVLDRLLPSGTIVAFGGTVAPAGWVLCDGSVRSGNDAAFSALFAVIGKTYGIGDGSAPSFNLPDLRGRTGIGAGQSPGLSNRALAAKLGIEAITQVPNHTHGVNITTSSSGSHSHTIPGWGASGGSVRRVDTAVGTIGANYATSTDGAHTHSVIGQSANNAGGVPSVDNLQPSLVVNYIIKL
jgi:microcystin-dependent protein